MSGDLIAFLSARLDEDEATAKAVLDAAKLFGSAPQRSTLLGHQVFDGSGIVVTHDRTVVLPSDVATHIARHDPARVLRKVAGKRAIIMRYERACTIPEPCVSFTAGQDDGYRQACDDAIRNLAAVYSDHADYRPEWAPDESG
jgi:hypothetical protein